MPTISMFANGTVSYPLLHSVYRQLDIPSRFGVVLFVSSLTGEQTSTQILLCLAKLHVSVRHRVTAAVTFWRLSELEFAGTNCLTYSELFAINNPFWSN